MSATVETAVGTGLALAGVNAYYGQSHVLHDVDLSVAPGELVFLLGRNGAGKTTTMASAAGVLTPRTGSVRLDDAELTTLRPHQVVKRGLALVPEDRRLFGEMTVEENLRIAERHARVSDDAWALETILEVLPVVRDFLDRKASRLSGGEQQMVAVARALMSNPRILLLDEPMEGLAPLVVASIERHMERLRDAGVGLLVSETQLDRALRLDGRAYVIDRGAVVWSGTTAELADARGQVERHLAV